MKKIAVIVAGGVGARMGLDIPKQFVRIPIEYQGKIIEDKEVLSYTLDAFEKHHLIDEIVVVTLDEYRDHVLEDARINNTTKLKTIVTGGATVQESIRNGIFSLEGYANEDDVIIIHDGVRPIVDTDVLTDVINVCIEKGNAVTSLPYNEQICLINENDENVTSEYINRNKLRRVSTPQAYKYGALDEAYHIAFDKEIGIYPPSYTNNMMVDLGYSLNFSNGSEKNIKLTTPDDIITFKSFKIQEYVKKQKELQENSEVNRIVENSVNLLDVEEYKEEIERYAQYDIDWTFLSNKKILISGATGMIGKCLIDILMYKNLNENLNCNIIALGRNREKALNRLGMYFNNDNFHFIECDINRHIEINDAVDYIIHAASSTHPLQYSNYPIETITANVMGTYNLLKLATDKKSKRFLFTSSVEVYGENRNDVDKFDEKYLGYIDCNTLRAGYPESKRTGEALCQAFIKQYDIDAIITRLSRVFGPTMLMSDSKASSQFIKNSVNSEDIVLKSRGLQKYSYSYAFDAVIGMLICLFKGKCGEAYNVCDEKFDITLKDFAETCAHVSNKEVVYDLPSETERAGYSTVTKALLDSSKINELGYKPSEGFDDKITKTIHILKKIYQIKNTN